MGSLYFRLAKANIRRNKELFTPYILTWIVTIAMYYILAAITFGNDLDQIGGGSEMRIILQFGCAVVAIFAVIFLFYTNSFIIKRRKKELSLYNILGMDKRHIGIVLFYEALLITLASLLIGLVSGILLSKLVYIILLQLLNQVPLTLSVNLTAIMITILLFSAVFVLILIYNMSRIIINDPIALLKEGQAGEREPKSKVLLTLFGILTLGAGYTIALVIENPLVAIGMFFVAVILVMVGTYALFTSGSIAFLKGLRRNKRFYYQSRHFNVVSGMLYRMKQNAVGLANICILSTMVLVTISTTVSLYIGKEQAIAAQYPYDISITTNAQSDEYNDDLYQQVNDLVAEKDIQTTDMTTYHYRTIYGFTNNGTFYTYNDTHDYDGYFCMTFIPLDEYNTKNGTDISLNDDEVLVYAFNRDFQQSELDLYGHPFTVKAVLSEINMRSTYQALISDCEMYYVVANDDNTIVDLFNELYPAKQQDTLDYTIMFDVSGDPAALTAFYTQLNNIGDNNTYLKTRNDVRDSFYGLYGGLLFIGIFIGSLFLMATAMIIYYKQVSEGYEDQYRYRILQNVGMSKKEIRKSVDFQIRLVFFLPLIAAVIHLAFAFKIISKMLYLFGLTDIRLFVICILATVASFAVIYYLIYRLTAGVYRRLID